MGGHFSQTTVLISVTGLKWSGITVCHVSSQSGGDSCNRPVGFNHLDESCNHERGALSLLAVTVLMASSNPLAGKQLSAKRHDEIEAGFNI